MCVVNASSYMIVDDRGLDLEPNGIILLILYT